MPKGEIIIKQITMKKVLMLMVAVSLSGCAEMQQVMNQFPQTQGIGGVDIAGGLKEALNNGISKQVTKLTTTDGFYRNELVKILLPEELRKVDSGLRKLGLNSLADEGLKVLNRAAEDAVKEATPIFVDAVRNMSFADARGILMGNQNSGLTIYKIALRLLYTENLIQ